MGKLGTAFGVFDGHGGVLAAEYATKHLTNNVLRMHQQQKGGGSRNRDAVDARRTMHALQEAFDVTDRELLQLARRKNFSDGTTALLLLFAGTELSPDFDGDPAAAETALTLFTAHVGDCRAVLCRGCTALRAAYRHLDGLGARLRAQSTHTRIRIAFSSLHTTHHYAHAHIFLPGILR